MSALDNDIQFLPGVGPKRAALLNKELDIKTFGDLLTFYPFRYIDRSTVLSIAEVVPDTAYVQVRARVVKTAVVPRKRFNATIEDGTGQMEVVFFKGLKWISEKLKPGMEFIFFGKPTLFNGRLNFTHPEVDPAPPSQNGYGSGSSYTPGGGTEANNYGPGSQPGPENFQNPNGGGTEAANSYGSGSRRVGAAAGIGTMTGVYPSTERLRSAGFTGRVMNKLMKSALDMALKDVEESLPEYVLKEKSLAPIKYALQNIHFPADSDALARAKYRLKFEELFYLQLALQKQKYIRRHNESGIPMPKVGPAFNACYEAIPFDLTGAQKKVIREIREDMRSGRQMNRLLQGDVGSGKTMVAVLCALIAIGNGYQACIMAPTEVLARQHFKNISKYLAPTGVRASILTGSTKVSERREILSSLADGSTGIIVGTHALIEDPVVFKRLGLAVIDEQHRFGVEQRSKLWNKAADGLPPHVLVMTATPIPRTLAMTFYGDLDISVIDELPPGRKPIETIHATEGKRLALNKFIREQIALGRQVFIVYPLIFESEKMDYKNLEAGYEQIVRDFPFPDYKVAIVHGRQANDVKQFNMEAFVAGRADILVSTSVIEVGVDVPNASVMVIESAERFGLSQLHQLRGRVGRGSEKSYCILMTGNKVTKDSRRRIELMCRTENGFELAEEDMKMRGPGDLEGTQQSGLPISLKIASLSSDSVILTNARDYAEVVLERDPTLSSPPNALLQKELRKDKYAIRDYSQIS